jgi:hypothetical protein
MKAPKPGDPKRKPAPLPPTPEPQPDGTPDADSQPPSDGAAEEILRHGP